MIPAPFLIGGAAILVGVLVAAIRKRAGESIAESAGRSVGEAAVGAVTGTVGGIFEAASGAGTALGESIGGGPLQFVPVPGRALYNVDRNIHRLQGQILYPPADSEIVSGVRTILYRAEIQNRSDRKQDVTVELDIDELGIDPYRHDGSVSIPAGEGVTLSGRRLLRSPLGFPYAPYTMRLYGNGYLLDKITFRVIV